MRIRSHFLLPALILALLATRASSHPADENTSLTLKETTQRFQQDRFGMFIHWGLYSLLGDGEWVMNDRKIPASDYEKLARAFNPADFNPAEWVALAKAAGMKYITFTAKHHDGFAMWHSDISDWNVVKRTPFARDVVRELTDECHLQGIKFYLYYSQLDWHHPDYFPRGNTGQSAGRPEKGDWNSYLGYQNTQLIELLRKYDPIAGIWFDGWWDRPDADWKLDQTYRLIHALEPAALIGNNHHRPPFAGENFQMYERDLPGENKAGFSATSQKSSLPLETCDTMNGSWGFRITDHKYKSTRELIHYLVRAAGADANFLLNVGPMPNGQIQPEFVQRLREIGLWMAKHGESIYGTRGGPMPPQPWGAMTSRGRKIYIHVLDPETSAVSISVPEVRIRTARTLEDEVDVPFTDDGGTVTLQLGNVLAGEIDRVILLQTRGRDSTETAVSPE